MIRVLLLISDGSWLVLLTAEKATLELAARTDIPRGEEEEPLESVAGFESHTTRHLPSRTMGSVSFCAQTGSPGSVRSSRTASTADSARRVEPMVSGVGSRNPLGLGPVLAGGVASYPGVPERRRCQWLLDRQRCRSSRGGGGGDTHTSTNSVGQSLAWSSLAGSVAFVL